MNELEYIFANGGGPDWATPWKPELCLDVSSEVASLRCSPVARPATCRNQSIVKALAQFGVPCW